MEKKRIVILGAGYGGLRALKKLQDLRPNAEMVLIDKNDYHCETTSLHEVAAGTTEATKICYPIASVVEKDKTRFIRGTVVRVDREARQVLLDHQKKVAYDYLLVALGFESEFFGIEGVEEYGLAITDIPSVQRIRRHIETQFAKWKDDHRDERLTIVVGGAGFTSFEFLGELTHRLPELIRRNHVLKNKVRVICVESSPNVLPMFDRTLAEYGTSTLEKRGVRFVVGRVSRVGPDQVFYKNGDEMKAIRTRTFVWGGGVRGSSVIEASGFNQRRGRVTVNQDLTVPGYPEIMIIGDCSAVVDPATGRPYPTTAQIAMQQADCAACNLNARIENLPLKPFVYKWKGTVCSLGRNDAMGQVMGANLKGLPASFMKKVIDNRSLVKIGGLGTMLKKGRFSLTK